MNNRGLFRGFRFRAAGGAGLAGVLVIVFSIGIWLALVPARAQLTDVTQAPNTLRFGIQKSLADQIGAGRGDIMTPGSSMFIIHRDPFRAIQRGRQLFQRKFTRAQGQGPGVGDGIGNLDITPGIASGLTDSCAMCHSQPPGSAGVGGSNTNRPDVRNAPHLFGVGIKEMLADEITTELRAIQAAAIAQAQLSAQPVTKPLDSKGINYGSITAYPDGSVDKTRVEGIRTTPNLRVDAFGWQATRFHLRGFLGGGVSQDVNGLVFDDPDLATACSGGRVVTPSGMVLDGSTDFFGPADCPPAAPPEQPAALVDYLEFYLLHYFKPGSYDPPDDEGSSTQRGRKNFQKIGCDRCHVLDLQINHDRRVADVETVYDANRGLFNHLFATATPQYREINDGSGFPTIKEPLSRPFLVRNIGTDFKLHDLGPNFHERNYDGTIRRTIKTPELWGVGSTPHYGHDGRSINLTEVILRHGGEAQAERDAFARLSPDSRRTVLDFLNSLIIFSPPNTASNLDPGNPAAANFPQNGHGSINLRVLFNDPADPE